jgi:hypothetical protein
MVPFSPQKRKFQMTVRHPTDPVLVVQNSTLWLSAVFVVMCLILLAAAFWTEVLGSVSKGGTSPGGTAQSVVVEGRGKARLESA